MRFMNIFPGIETDISEGLFERSQKQISRQICNPKYFQKPETQGQKSRALNLAALSARTNYIFLLSCHVQV